MFECVGLDAEAVENVDCPLETGERDGRGRQGAPSQRVLDRVCEARGAKIIGVDNVRDAPLLKPLGT